MARFQKASLFAILLLSGALASCSRQEASNGDSTPRGGSEIEGGHNSGADVRSSGPPMTFEQAPITDIKDIFAATNPAAMWTRSINLTSVPVQRIAPDKQFIFVGPDAEHALAVQMKELHPEIKQGQRVDVAGVINHLGHDLSQWNVDPEDRQMLAGRAIYIQATAVNASQAK